MLKMTDLDLKGKQVLIRVDLNVPIANGKVTSSKRIEAILPTLKLALQQGAGIILLSHLGRPKEGEYDPQYSLAPVAKELSQLLHQEVKLLKDLPPTLKVKEGEIVLLENVRFLPGEKANDARLSQKLADLGDVFVMDAFATAHRKEASTYGVAEYAPIACAGPLLVSEINALQHVMENPRRPLVAIVGGSKVSTKLLVLKKLLPQVDCLIVGGGIANTFLVAQGFSVGKSLYEPELVAEAKELLKFALEHNITLALAQDVIVATEFSEAAKPILKTVSEVSKDEMILDIGPKTTEALIKIIATAQTILWNGPVGVFEWNSFAAGTGALATAIAKSSAFSVAGGGDTLAAIEKYGIEKDISYISTGGGAFLEFFEGQELPSIAILQKRARSLTEV